MAGTEHHYNHIRLVDNIYVKLGGKAGESEDWDIYADRSAASLIIDPVTDDTTIQVGDGTTCADLIWYLGSATRFFKIDASSGFVGVGTTMSITISDGDGSTNCAPGFQVIGASKADGSLLLASFAAANTSAVAPSLNLLKSGNATIGSNTVVADNEILGEINFFGADGTDFESAGARIHCSVDGTPGTGVMPGDLVFSTTPPGSETLAARWTIAAEGTHIIAASTAPASVATSTGTAASAILAVTGGVGGATSIATTGTGGVGGGFSLTGGAGGLAALAVTSGTGGAGGAFALTTGAGGASAVTGAGAGTGGAGGAIDLVTGAGGAVSTSSGTNTGGASGAVSISSGTGGAAAGGTDTGGASGPITIQTGTGGAGDLGGASGDLTLGTGAVGAGGSPTPGVIVFKTAATERIRIYGEGMVVGHTTKLAISDGDGSTNCTPEVQIVGTTKADSSVLIANFSATETSAAAPALNFLKSAHATIGSNTAAESAGILGEINFFAADGSDFESAGARIHAKMDAVASTGAAPASLVFSTTPAASETLAARYTVSAQGLHTIAASTTPASVASTPGTAAGAILTVTGGVGGATTNASGVGGIGSGFVLTGGAGGASSGGTAATGGAGGAFALTTGAGAASAAAGA
ncbi:MAG: hypothetical protein ABIF82_05020, partial [Planctomycetota bacterium]